MELTIRKPKSDSINTRWIAAYWDGVAWEARAWRIRLSQSSDVNQDTGKDGYTWWRYLDRTVNHGETFWVVGWRMYELLCWSGLYDAINSGWLQLRQYRRGYGNHASANENPKLQGALICEDPPTIVDGQLCRGGKVKFLDLMNWGINRDMIASTGESDGLQDTIQAIQDYISLCRTCNLGQTKTTAASQGYYCYRRSHLHQELVANDDVKVRRIERAAYFSGRSECLRIGKLPGTVYHLDVSSMYSAIGLESTFPTRLIPHYLGKKIGATAWLSNQHNYIADVTINTPAPLYPVRHDKRIIWPVGEYRTVLAWPELRHAAISGHIKDIHAVLKYEQADIFSAWSNWYFMALQSLEHNGLAHLRSALKLIVNATYGKIGSRGRSWIDRPAEKARAQYDQWWQRHPDNGTPVQWRCIDGLSQYLDAGIESPSSMPSVSATMSSYGRIQLLKIIQAAGRDNVYYYDTDGIMVNETAYNSLTELGMVRSGVPGKLRIREVSDDVEIIGVKHYRFGQRYCCAGVPLDRIVKTNGTTEYEIHEPFADNLWHRRAFMHAYHMRSRKHEQRYLHGYVLPGGQVVPFRMGLIDGDHDGTGDASDRESVYGVLGAQGLPDW